MREAVAKVTTNSADWVSKLQLKGVAIIPNILKPDQVAELIRAIERAQRATPVGKRSSSVYGMRNLLQIVPAVRRISGNAAIRSLVEPVLGSNAFPVRGLLFDKTAEANWKVAWHQDLSIAVQQRVNVAGFGPWSIKAGVIHVQPPVGLLQRMMTLRLHLDDCDEGNGPLKVLPGSHTQGKLSAGAIQACRGRIPEMVCPVKCGGVVLMRPLLLHASSSAIMPTHRRVIHLEFAAEPLPDGMVWLNPVALPR